MSEIQRLQKFLDKIEPQLQEAAEKSMTGEILQREHGVLTSEELEVRLR